ncbi:MAG: phosphodiester glycosidase family protein, partial [Candidatus Gracilibacteria bacterium]|nr:phosphodiester glycosidase family protein [Candidatus Gracilibacteria bacterium]
KCYQNTWEYKGYNFISGTDGINIYQDNFKSVSVIDVDLSKSGISFGGVTQVDTKYLNSHNGLGYINKRFQGQLKAYNLQKEKNGSNFNNFKRKFVQDAFGENNFLKNGSDYNDIFAVVNGQFFNANKENTTLSFPVKSNGTILNSYVDNDKKKRTVIIDKMGVIKIMEGYNESYLNDKNNKEVLVGINPSEDFSKNRSVGRTYMGLIGDDRVVFFIAQSKTQHEMKKIALDYGIEGQNLVMLDGGPSSQFAYFDIFEVGGGINSFYGGWEVPHSIMIFKK